MKHYTVGFLFSDDLKHILLIQKNRPEWQKGKLNGVGGHIEENETPKDCMIREFKEETGLIIYNWDLFATLKNNDNWIVHFYKAISDDIHKSVNKTDEILFRILVDDISNNNVLENLKWLIPLALSNDNGKPLYIYERTIDTCAGQLYLKPMSTKEEILAKQDQNIFKTVQKEINSNEH